MTGLPDNFDEALDHAVLPFEGKEGVSWKKKDAEGCYTEKSEWRGMQISVSSFFDIMKYLISIVIVFLFRIRSNNINRPLTRNQRDNII